MKYIDTDKPDPFDPSNFFKDDMQFIEKKNLSTEEYQPQNLDQIDLMCILMCSEKILDMVQYNHKVGEKSFLEKSEGQPIDRLWH